MASKKKPRFFCDNCNAEVPANASKCPSCGRYFSSVRCPSCGFSGDEALFRNGCISCGYSSPPSTAIGNQRPPPRKMIVEALPLWVYILTALAFLAIVGAIIYRFF